MLLRLVFLLWVLLWMSRLCVGLGLRVSGWLRTRLRLRPCLLLRSRLRLRTGRRRSGSRLWLRSRLFARLLSYLWLRCWMRLNRVRLNRGRMVFRNWSHRLRHRRTVRLRTSCRLVGTNGLWNRPWLWLVWSNPPRLIYRSRSDSRSCLRLQLRPEDLLLLTNLLLYRRRSVDLRGSVSRSHNTAIGNQRASSGNLYRAALVVRIELLWIRSRDLRHLHLRLHGCRALLAKHCQLCRSRLHGNEIGRAHV